MRGPAGKGSGRNRGEIWKLRDCNEPVASADWLAAVKQNGLSGKSLNLSPFRRDNYRLLLTHCELW